MTQKDRHSTLLVVCPNVEAVSIGKSVDTMLGRDGERKISSEDADFMLPRKVSIEDVGACTVNRHR